MLKKLIYTSIAIAFFAACKSPEARRPVQTRSGSFINESVVRNKEIYDQEKMYIEELIEKDSLKDYIASESGFWYYYNVKDTTSTEMPDIGDIVEFTYDIKNLDGSTILSKEENGLQQYRVDESNQELISGVRDGIKLMKEGETITFFFPSYKAFGYYGIEEKLGTNVPIQSTITLHSLEQSNEN
ncbi:gliding motility-associated peptidyl-prolyl isomerase GldI [Aequorivita echinoideorum]|uniref:Peptidyl-prolyl cis-trans isomerase n=1 Tax=Aequorivita echinoideorum TaxID=1549647 RepID=A0ABS5S723_9FLAO|nr:gliding motility-associated peptidyl-prolyl isomerase GldI [Aequorivita echinoideorum]MBT0608220.1 gliding motility-associated peptidyl-prolyl isomerase GldI [Aequorivita echinoideorum]